METLSKEAGIFDGAVRGATRFLGNTVAPMFASGLKPVSTQIGGAAARFASGNAPRVGAAAQSVAAGLARPGPRLSGARAAAATFGQQASAPAAALGARMRARAGAAGVGVTGRVSPPTGQNSFGHLAWNAVRGATGFGPSANATGTAKAVAGLSMAGMIGAPLAMGAFGSRQSAGDPYQQQMGMQVTASDRGDGLYTVKTAFGTADKVRAGVDLASYGALAAPLATKLIAPKFYNAHQGLMHGLDVAGLAGLTGTGLYGMATGRGRERSNDALDVGGLGLMGLALHRRLNDH